MRKIFMLALMLMALLSTLMNISRTAKASVSSFDDEVSEWKMVEDYRDLHWRWKKSGPPGFIDITFEFRNRYDKKVSVKFSVVQNGAYQGKRDSSTVEVRAKEMAHSFPLKAEFVDVKSFRIEEVKFEQ